MLLVQPERDDRDMYAEFMRRAGLASIVVSSATHALALAPDSDVVVTDLLLPGHMDGIEFIARLRSDDRTRRIPIIVLTACGWKTERQRAESSGCDAFLPKPCLPEDLLSEIRRLVMSSRIGMMPRRPAKARLPGEADARRRQDRTG